MLLLTCCRRVQCRPDSEFHAMYYETIYSSGPDSVQRTYLPCPSPVREEQLGLTCTTHGIDSIKPMLVSLGHRCVKRPENNNKRTRLLYYEK